MTTFADALTELNIRLGDDDNFTFTPEEKTSALTTAWRDRYVVNTVVDTNNTFNVSTQNYTINNVTSVSEVSYSNDSTWGDPLPSDAWSFSAPTLSFDQAYRYQIPASATIRVKGKYKLTTTDDITDDMVFEYVLKLAHLQTLTLLGAKKTNRFIKNDTNMNEIIALRNSLATEIIGMRQGFQQAYERV